jgi:hypothetical protein
MPPEPSFSSEQTELIREFNAVLPLFAGPGRVAVTLGGSQAKQKSDARSDFDFRVYADVFHTEDWPQSPGWAPFQETLQRWEARGYRIDGFWPRKIADIDTALERWIAGEIEPVHLVWTVWGYHLPTDIYAQYVVSDPDGVAAGVIARSRLLNRPVLAVRDHPQFAGNAL